MKQNHFGKEKPMASKKRVLFVALAAFSMLLGACSVGKSNNNNNSSSQKESQNTSESTQPSSSSNSSSSDPSSDTSSEETSSSESSSEQSSTSSSEEQVVVESISVKEGTVKTEFFVNDEFVVDGGILVVKYSYNARQNINLTLDMIQNVPNMAEPHENYEVNVEYEGATTSYFINVIQSDTRIDVDIEVAYDYKGGEAQEMVDNLEFVVGKSYHFYFGCNPSEAKDAISYKYMRLGDDPEDLGSEKPYELGEYSYSVYIPEGDDTYKPVSLTYHYSIVEPVTKGFTLNSENAPELGNDAGNAHDTVDGIVVNYKNAKAAEDKLATLVKQCDANVNPNEEDNYIEIASPTLLTSALVVEFSGEDNYVLVYGSYDLEHFYLVDTLTLAKQGTNRAQDYFYFRLVGAPLGHSDITIKNISFSYEEDGALDNVAAMAENSDRFNHVSSAENNAYFHRRDDMVYDENYSTKSIGIRLKECSVRVDFGTVIKASEVKYYQVSFKYNATPDIAIQYSKDDTTPQDNAPIYAKPVSGETTVGKHLKDNNHVVQQGQTEWGTITFDLINFFDDEPVDIDGLNVWISRYCAQGAAVFDDFRLVQKNTYPVPFALESIAVSDVTTEYTVGQAFEFDGVVTATYTDQSTKVIANDDPNLEITAPNTASSGKKEVKISYTEGGVTKKTSYIITVSATGNPEEEEILPIVAEENDLAKASNQHKSGREYDCGKIKDDTEETYGNSTNSIRIYNLKVDADCYVNIQLPSALTQNSIHVKFFAKNLPADGIYCQLMDTDMLSDKDANLQRAYVNADQVGLGKPKTSVNTNQESEFHFTATEAGNGWTMYEYDFYSANVTNGVNFFRISTVAKLAADTSFYVDGLQIY